MASILDIAVMKVTAIGGRGAKKDFFDLYNILISEDISVVWIIYSQKNVTNPNFVDVDIEMLTIANVDNSNVIEKDGQLYNVKFIIPGKYNQVFLQKC